MKISVLQNNLHKALEITSRLSGGNTNLPILSNVLLVTKNGQLQLQSTNLEIAISYVIGAKIEKEGSVSVPARLLSELIGSLQKDKIQLTKTKDNLEVHGLDLSSIINGTNPEDFPKIPEVKISKKFTIDTSKFTDSLEYVLPAVSLDDSRPILTGILLQLKSGVLNFAATDSYRLAQCQLKSIKCDDLSVVVPSRTITELVRILKSEQPDTIEVGLSDTEVMFSTKNFTVTSQLIDGNYPDYTKIVPEKNKIFVELQKDNLLNGLKIASLFSRDNAHSITIAVAKDGINILSEGAQVGKNTSHVEASTTGGTLDINLNAQYLISALNSIHSKKIYLCLEDKLAPFVITQSKDMANTNFHIIMPLRS